MRIRITILQPIKAVLECDDGDIKKAIQRLVPPVSQPSANSAGTSSDSVLTFLEAAKRLGKKSSKSAMNWANEGLLERSYLPGRKRANGVKESSVLALIQQRKKES